MVKNEKLQEILKRFNTSKDYYSSEYERNKEDYAFALGDQWPEDIKSQRIKERRPCLTENRVLTFVNQVVNGIRQSRPSVVVKPVDNGADVETAKILRGIIKNIETVSDAETAYDTSAFSSVAGGYGHLRIKTDYADYDTFDQEIQIERILNPFSVYFDPTHTRLDASDAEYVFVLDEMSKEDFEAEYPKAINEGFSDGWSTQDSVIIADYFYKHYEKKTLYEYEIVTPLGTQRLTGYELPSGVEAIRKRDVQVCSIKYCKVTGAEILEEGDFPSKYLPVVPVLGLETWYNDKRQVFSLIHQAKDPQRMYNFWKTASTEIIALQPKAPYIAAAGQLKGFEKQWASANTVNHSVLYYNPITKDGMLAPAPERQQPPTASGAMFQETMSAADGIKASLGVFDASLGQNTNDISGKAIISRQLQGDNATFHFIDNLSTALKHVGRILVDMIPRVYVGDRIVRVLGEDGTEKLIPLNQPVVKVDGGDYKPAELGQKPTNYFQLDAGKYDVVVEVGPSYATKRQETANALIELSKTDPRIMDVAGDILVSNLDIPNASELAERIRATMSPELLGEDLEARRLQQMAEQTAMLQEKLQQTELALQVKEDDQRTKNNLELMKIENDRREIEIKAAEAQAKIAKMQAETENKIPAEAMNEISQVVERLNGQVEDIYGAMEEVLAKFEREAEEIVSERENVVEMASGEPESPVTKKEDK